MGSPREVADEFDALVSGGPASVLQLDDDALLAAGHAALDVILLRTKRGLDVDHRTFTPYTEQYAEFREKKGRSASTVDLAFTGHMQQAITVVRTGDDVTLEFMNAHESIKASAHNSGVDKNIYVRSHRRKTAVNIYTGQRVSAAEAKRDKRRKNQKVGYRTESVDVFQRHQRTPKREWFDIRHSSDVQIVENAISLAFEAKANRDSRFK